MKFKTIFPFLFLLANICLAQEIPLPEHPRPDFERKQWQNLNGNWSFEFDSLNIGEKNNWQSGKSNFSKTIKVPFPWGSPLSGIKDEADIAWYKRDISVNKSWANKQTYFTIGASDWLTTVWFDGQLLGSHQGGYTPFSFDLTPFVKYGQIQKLVIKVDDKRRDFTLYGKQGYGNARGIWQTAYLEAKGETHFESIHFTTDIDNETVSVEASFNKFATKNQKINIRINGSKSSSLAYFKSETILSNQKSVKFKIDIPKPKLWSLENPFLYNVIIETDEDTVKSYFGMRKISVTNLPGTDIPYIALNNKPIYLQLALDQSYHPDGFYTFPTDAFMKNEIQLSKNIGLNGIRTHIKVDIPRKLYWADKLGLLVMSDLPNFWGEPDSLARAESEYTLEQMIKRDYNHPSIFSWIVFNETWGLRTKVKNEITGKDVNKYLPETQKWVVDMYKKAKELDVSRLIEDNSICCGAGHTETDINSWHEYLPGYEWEKHMQTIDKNTYNGSQFHFEKGYSQKNQPMINSECGNVWGYNGSTGDVDWSYDYHRMMNVFRMHPNMAGWLYTEHHDVINEWNGYWRFDRSMKFTGLNEILTGMTDKDLHSYVYLSNGQDITHTVNALSKVKVPIYISVMKELKNSISNFSINYKLEGINTLGQKKVVKTGKIDFLANSWMQKDLDSLEVKMPPQDGLYTLSFVLKDNSGEIHHHNFVNFIVKNGSLPPRTSVIDLKPNAFKNANWSLKKWEVMNGDKMNGAGQGFFEYEFETKNINFKNGFILVELGAKQLFAKDKPDSEIKNDNYMLGAKAEPSQNTNSYPMTDELKFPSLIEILIDNKLVKTELLADDPADHRGILSWHNQKQNRTLEEAGSYGYLIKIPLNSTQLKSLKIKQKINIKLSTKASGGIAVYGANTGRFPFNPSLVLID